MAAGHRVPSGGEAAVPLPGGPLLPFGLFAALALRPSPALQRRAPALSAGVAAVALVATGATLVHRFSVALW